jgi:hypothetical protein
MIDFFCKIEQLGFAPIRALFWQWSLQRLPIHSLAVSVRWVQHPAGGLSGGEVAAELKRRRFEVKGLLMSGNAGEILAREGLLGSCDVTFNKPFQLNDLACKVREVRDA